MDRVRRSTAMRSRAHAQDGFTFLESMIAITILCIGLRALAAMQSVSLRGNLDAKELALSTNLAAGMIERIHSNRQNVVFYNGIDSAINPPPGGEPCPNASAIAVPSRPTARGDCLQWQAALDNSGLDNVQGLVQAVNPFGPLALNQTQVVVRINWNTKRGTEHRVVRPAFIQFTTVVTPP